MTFNHEEIPGEQYVKELEEEVMSVVEQARCQNMVQDFCNVKLITSVYLVLLVKIHKRIRERGGYLKIFDILRN